MVEPDEYYTLVVSIVGRHASNFYYKLVNERVTVTIYNDDGKKLHMFIWASI